MTSAQIAGELHLSVNTIRSYVQSILSKLGVHTRIEALARARRLRLI
jgi:DNA-binding NarL/FixJ family response regulator